MDHLPGQAPVLDPNTAGELNSFVKEIEPVVQEVESPGARSEASYHLHLAPESRSQSFQILQSSVASPSEKRSTFLSVHGSDSDPTTEDEASQQPPALVFALPSPSVEDDKILEEAAGLTPLKTSDPDVDVDETSTAVHDGIDTSSVAPVRDIETIHKRVTIAEEDSDLDLKTQTLEVFSPPSLTLPPENRPERRLLGQVGVPEIQGSSKRDDGSSLYPEDAITPVIETVQASSVAASNLLGPNQESQVVRNAHTKLIEELEACTTMVAAKTRPDANDKILRRKGRRKIVFQKHAMQASQLSFNAFFIFATWWWPRYYYILLPFITATVALNVIMVFDLLVLKLKHVFWPPKVTKPLVPESLVLLVPCYNETKDELLKSLSSLAKQQDIDAHKRAILIVVDGKVRGPGMLKTTANYLLDEILIHKTERRYMRDAYIAWDQQCMDIVIQRGTFQGLPYFCVVKQQNQGKRDGLIVARSFLYNFNIRLQKPNVIFNSKFFAEMAAWLIESGIDKVDCLIGMDADTQFEESCISNLLKESRYNGTVGVCGFVAIDWSQGPWNPWRLYQFAEYTIAQCLRRLHQSKVTKKVSCLPGCCQLLKVCEETCGEEVLIEKFGYCPTVKDGLLKHIRATASEDRNHVCRMLSARPQSQTRQALAAKGITDVPHSWSVFLSQRRRWTLGATSNDLFLVFAPGVQWFERIIAAVNVITWYFNPFIIASLVSFVYACTVVEVWIIMCFVAVMLIPITYYLCIPFWLPMTFRERIQFWAGCACYIFGGPFLNIIVLIYASWYMDSFGWGKTRKVISEDTSDDNIEDSSGSDEKVIDKTPAEAEAVSEDRVQATIEAEKRVGG